MSSPVNRAFVSGCEGPSIAEESCSMRVVSFVKPSNLSLSIYLSVSTGGYEIREIRIRDSYLSLTIIDKRLAYPRTRRVYAVETPRK
jgi:hypothetical protein